MRNSSVNKTIAILFVVIILPIAIFTFFQLDNLKENEKSLADVQRQQLETIIFSINQYSDDVMKSLLLKLENIASIPSLSYSDLLKKYPGVDEVAIYRDLDESVEFLSQNSLIGREEVMEILSQNASTIQKLKEYKNVGFSKLEPFNGHSIKGENYNLLAFIIKDLQGLQSVCILFINSNIFIENFLAPTMQKLAADNYVITAYYSETDRIVFATDSTNEQSLQTMPMWLLPDHEIQVNLKRDSAAEVAKKRYHLNLLWTGILVAVLLLGFVVIIRNIKKEIQLAQLKSDFVSSVSHEIRTPLALINMFAETLMLNRVKDEQKKLEYYEIISKETSRLKNIVNKILNFSQLESKKRAYTFEMMTLDEVVKDTIGTYSYHLNDKGFDYEEKYNASDVKLSIDREAFMEAIINLVDNAMKYSEEVKRVEIETGKKDKEVFVKIKDYGIGITQKDQQMIFDKFFRVTKGELYKVPGAGLGLSITKNIIDGHAGNIKIESELGKGSTFIISLPIK